MKKRLLLCAAALLLLAGCARTYLSREKCEDLAFADAGVLRADVSSLQSELDGGTCEVEFIAGGWEYEYTVDRKDGGIVSAGKEQLPGQPAAQSPTGEQATPPEDGQASQPEEPAADTYLTEEEVRALVADRLPDADLAKLYLELDWDDGRRVYEGELRTQDMEYEFEIDALTGEFLSWEEEARG